MEFHKLKEFITSALQEIINETFVITTIIFAFGCLSECSIDRKDVDNIQVPANIFPTLMVRMRRKYTAEVEYVKISDNELLEKFYRNLNFIKDVDLDGHKLAASYFSQLDPKLTFWGDKNIM